jgi:hypothetical protein
MRTGNARNQRVGRSWIYGLVISAVAILLPGQLISANTDVDLWPLLELNDNTTTVCYPLYSQEGKFKMIMNLYVNTDDGKEHHIFWPFVKFSEDKLERLTPFYFSDTPNEFILFPFMFQTQNFTLWTVPPVYMRKDGDFKAVIPLYIKNKNSLFVFPNIFINEEPDGKSVDVFPFYSYSHKKIANSVRDELRIGNYVYSENFERKSSAFFPLYAKEIAKNSQADSSFMIVPYYHEWCDERNYSKHIFAPFFATKTSKEESYTWLLNYYKYQSENKSTLNVFPFYGVTEEVNYQRETTKESMWVVWPFYARERKSGNDGKVIAKNNRFLIFSNNLERSGKRTFSIFGKVITERMN